MQYKKCIRRGKMYTPTAIFSRAQKQRQIDNADVSFPPPSAIFARVRVCAAQQWKWKSEPDRRCVRVFIDRSVGSDGR